MCVANTYGPRDYAPTPHGGLLEAASMGKMPFYVKGIANEVVGIEDAAEALLLAAEHGRIGQRYIISERFMTARELYSVAADAGGVRPPRFGVPLAFAYAAGYLGDAAAKLLRRICSSQVSLSDCSTSCLRWTTRRQNENSVGDRNRYTTRSSRPSSFTEHDEPVNSLTFDLTVSEASTKALFHR